MKSIPFPLRALSVQNGIELSRHGSLLQNIFIYFPSLSVPYTHLIGHLSTIPIPVYLRPILYGIYAYYYGVNMKEANEDFRAYKNFALFFIRPLKPGSRSIDNSLLVSPADGIVVQCGEVVGRKIDKIKDHEYEIDELLGPVDSKATPPNKLYQFVIHLLPKDYHAFHSPANWEVHTKVEHKGHMLPVKIRKWVPAWFCINARVCLIGKWKYGFFSMTPVAATTVGKIALDPGPMLSPAHERDRERTGDYAIYDQHFRYRHGDKIGEFHAGSIIVLIFEAPPGLKFCVKPDQTLHYGNRIVETEL
uniref:phosphatidylserine decarboxylase n=1 Tax=Acrobeloides nanus TaxID=290746 RepID=A0A914E3F3_9BILA